MSNCRWEAFLGINEHTVGTLPQMLVVTMNEQNKGANQKSIWKLVHERNIILSKFISDSELQGAGSLLRKYVSLLCNHITDILPLGASLATISCKHFSLVSKIISSDVTGLFTHHTSDIFELHFDRTILHIHAEGFDQAEHQSIQNKAALLLLNKGFMILQTKTWN